MIEEWRDVVGYEDLYQVSSMGRVRNVRRGTVLKTHPDRAGYIKIGLSKNGRQTGKFVHRLVAEAFIDNPESKTDVNHKNGIKGNNNLSNLEWNTRSENLLHAYRTGLLVVKHGEEASRSKFTEEQVSEIKILHESGISQSSIARVLGVTQPTISYIVNGVNWREMS